MAANIYDLLPVGKSNAITAKELLRRTNHRDIRKMREQIRRERLAGALILSTKRGAGGYYRPESRKELQAFVTTFEREASSTSNMLLAAKMALTDGDYS